MFKSCNIYFEVDTVGLTDRCTAVFSMCRSKHVLAILAPCNTQAFRVTNNFSVFMRVRGVCAWVLFHKPINTSRARYFLHCFWSPFKEMNAK